MDDATDLDSAVEALLADDTPATDNLDGAVDEILTPDGDTQEADDDATDEDQDGLDASEGENDDADADDAGGDEDADDDTDEEDEDEDAEKATLYPVKIDGKEEQWTLEQLKQSAAGQGYINKQMQTQAEQRKELETSAAQLAQERQAVFEAFQRLQSGTNLTPPKAPTKEMFNLDPIGYMEKRIEYDDAMAEYQKSMQSFQQLDQQQTHAQKQERAEKLKLEAEQLAQYIPEFADAEKRPAIISALSQSGQEYGFSQEEMMGITDSRMLRALNDARKFRQIEAKQKTAVAKSKDARPMVKAGAKKAPSSAKAGQRQQAQERLAKTGKIDDAISLMFE